MNEQKLAQNLIDTKFGEGVFRVISTDIARREHIFLEGLVIEYLLDNSIMKYLDAVRCKAFLIRIGYLSEEEAHKIWMSAITKAKKTSRGINRNADRTCDY